MQRRDGSLTLCIQHEAPEGEKRTVASATVRFAMTWKASLCF
jgi:hypothetical protein